MARNAFINSLSLIFYKLVFYKLENRNIQSLCALGCGVLYFISALVTPRFIPLLEPDSYSYLEFYPTRTSFYPIFLDMMQFFGLSLVGITYLQLLIFTISLIVILHQFLRDKLPLLLTIGFYLAMLGNIYLTSYHFSILAESLSFSLILLTITFLWRFIKNKNVMDFFWMIVFTSIAIGMKPALLSICIGVIASKILLRFHMESWQKTLKVMLLVGFAPIIIISLLETTLYATHHDARQSLTPNHLFGKAVMLTLFDGFGKQNIKDDATRDLIGTIEHTFAPAKTYLMNIDNFCLRAKLYTEYANYGQHHLLKEQFPAIVSQYGEQLQKFQTQFSLSVIMHNPLNYIKLTGINYLAFFCAGASDKLSNHNNSPPIINNDGIQNSVASQSPLALYYIFLILGIMFFAISVFYALRFLWVILCKIKKTDYSQFTKQEIYAMHLLLWVHGYHLSVALTGPVITRYLMISYPLIILSIIITGFAWLTKECTLKNS